MVPSKQVDVVGTSGTEDKTVSGRRQSARGTGAAGGPAEDAAPRPKRAEGKYTDMYMNQPREL